MNQEKRAREIEQFFITITRASAALEVALKRDFGLSLGEYRVLDEVASTGEIGIRMGELAQSVIFSPSRLTHTYRRLASRNLVVRPTSSTVAAEQSRSQTRERNSSPRRSALSELFFATSLAMTFPTKTSASLFA